MGYFNYRDAIREAIQCGYIDAETWKQDAKDGQIVTLYGGELCHIDSAIYCDYEEDYCHGSEAVEYRDGRHCKYTWENSRFYSRELHYYEGDYYTSEGLSYHDLVILSNGEIIDVDDACYVEEEGEYYSCDDCYYWESDGEYHLSPEPEKQGGLFPYKSQTRQDKSGGARVCVGVEIEKEDASVFDEELDAPYLMNKYGFIMESDGSLDDESGFELISPQLALNENIMDYFKPVRDLIEADYSDSCGGHIHYSVKGKSGAEIYADMGPIVPLLYALYPKRKIATYSEGKKAAFMSGRYVAVNILSNRIEFRIFPAVKNMNNLAWRLELLRLWSENMPSYSKVLRMLSNKKSWLYIHLSKVCDADKKRNQYSRELAYFLDSDVTLSSNTANKAAEKVFKSLKTA